MLNGRVYSAVQRVKRERESAEREWILEIALPCQFGIWARAAQLASEDQFETL